MARVPRGVSFTCDVPRVIVNPHQDHVRLTFRELKETDLMEMLSGAVSAFNRLLAIREEERERELEGAMDESTGLQQDS